MNIRKQWHVHATRERGRGVSEMCEVCVWPEQPVTRCVHDVLAGDAVPQGLESGDDQ